MVIGLILGTCGLVATERIIEKADDQYQLQRASSGVSTVLSAHYTWRQGLTEAVLAGTEFTGSVDPNGCALGQWRSSDEARSISDSQVLALLDEVNTPHTYIHTQAKAILAMMEAGDMEGAEQDLLENVLPETARVISILSAIDARYADMLDESGIEIAALGTRTKVIIYTLNIFAIILSAVLGIVILKSIMRPLRAITKAAQTIATGDLDANVQHNVDDEIGRLAKSFNDLISNTREQVRVAEALADGDLTVQITPRSGKDSMNFALQRMVANLSDMFAQISSSTNQVSIGAKQIADGAQMLAQGATEQASTIQQLSSSMSDVAEKTRENSVMAGDASELAGSIKTRAETGTMQMERMIQAVKEINEASESISKVIKTIDDIAFQTNILALNAAVEAARAGQHGKGFAVVAEEVRSLAAKSAEAAKDTDSLIVNAIEKAQLGTQIAVETASSLGEIVSGIDESTQIVQQIADASEGQNAAISEINQSIDQVAQVVQQNSAAAEESAASSQEMDGQANLLQGFVAKFKLKDSIGLPSRFSSANGEEPPGLAAPSAESENKYY